VRSNKALSILIAVETNGEVCTEMRESQVSDLAVIELNVSYMAAYRWRG